MAKPCVSNFTEEHKARFWENVLDRPDNGCWEWRGSKFDSGYGRFNALNRTYRANRVALYFKTGEMPERLESLHSCDNPGCVNPSHLKWGTTRENQREKADRGRVAGEINGRSKLTRDNVAFIRTCGLPTRRLIEMFSISKPTINRIKRGVGWA